MLIAAGHDKPPPAGLALATILYGDFEITTGYEILKADVPLTGFGGRESSARAVGLPKNAVSLRACCRADKRSLSPIEHRRPGRQQHRLNTFPACAANGRLRLKLWGTVHFRSRKARINLSTSPGRHGTR